MHACMHAYYLLLTTHPLLHYPRPKTRSLTYSMIHSLISAHPVALITMHYCPQAGREWCRILAAPDRFLGESTGAQKSLLNFFVQCPVRRSSVCMYVCMYACMHVSIHVSMHVCSYESMGLQIMRMIIMALLLVGDDYIRVVENEYNLFSDT